MAANGEPDREPDGWRVHHLRHAAKAPAPPNEQWIVFVTSTNVEALEEAVTRRGRLDKVSRVGPPTLAPQMRSAAFPPT